SVLLETARTLSVLRGQGWQPKRTVMLALWDGEEFGLMGSTEWLEKHLNEMDLKGAVYINSDSTGRGALGVGGSHTLESFMGEVLRDVTDPGTSRSLLEAAQERRTSDPRPREFHLEPLGSGSDYTAFLDHAGVASLNLGFGSSDGVYHSIYDTLSWYERFSDGDRSHGKALTQVMSTAILRLADAPVLPFEFNTLSSTVGRYVNEIRRELPSRPPRVDLRGVGAQLARLSAASKAYEEELAAWSKRPGAGASEKLVKANEAIERTERALLLPDGLPHREWYRHQIYAPGLYTGYAAKTIPGVREAVEAKQWDEANQQVRRLTQTLRDATAQVEEATRLLKPAE
ncbi:MAG: transferrin receptor-like dimerization domain-containing protein, partial [Bryobacteraceae bacterium]